MYTRLRGPTFTRLLTILPGDNNSNINACLEEVDLEVEPMFECLSYTWGNSTETARMTVNDTTITIRKNLHDFMIKLRSTNEARIVWVDAISISQTDLDEKAHQVAMIGRISGQAARVLVWVGERADSSDVLFQPTAAASLWRKALGVQPQSAILRQRVTLWNAFLSRPYWKRTWIVQEIICARAIVVHCGADFTDWDSLIKPRVYSVGGLCFDGISLVSSKLEKAVGAAQAERFVTNALKIEKLANSRWSYWQAVGTTTPGHQIIYIFPSFASNESFDRRDKIYAMLSLEPDRLFREAIGVDYTISVEELFSRVLSTLGRTWNGRLAASSLIKIFDMSQREVAALLQFLPDGGCVQVPGSVAYLERYVRSGITKPFSDAPEGFMGRPLGAPQ